MPRAEKGTPKAIANQQKSKGLQRLRWYCQVCEKQCRDENGFKCHVQSEAHVRQMLIVGENPARHVANFSRQFMGDFLQLLRTTHGEKRVQANHFYASQYIANKNHIHMNATRWRNLTEFITFLGIQGICRVENTEKGWFISWIDTSPEALKKRDANLKRERLEKGEADREDRLIQEQVERARQEAIEKQLDASEKSFMDEDSDNKVKTEDEAEGGSTTEDGAEGGRKESSAEPKTKMEDIEQRDEKPAAPISFTIQKPIKAPTPNSISLKPANPLKSFNPLAPKKSNNPLKSVMKEKSMKIDASAMNDNGKRPLPKAVEIMNEELQRKKLRDERYNHNDNRNRYDRDGKHEVHHRSREVYIGR